MRIECTAEIAALYHYYDVEKGEYKLHTKGGLALYTSVRFSQTDEHVVLERICPVRQKAMRQYVEPESEVVLIRV